MWLRSRSISSVPTMLTTRSYSRGIGIAHGRSEECPRRRLPRSRSFRVHHFRGFDSLGEKANPPIDLPQPPLAVLIVGVLTAIAVAGSPRHHLRHGRAFPGEQKPVLIFEALESARRDVVLDWRPGRVRLRFSGEAFSHLVVFPGRIQWMRRHNCTVTILLAPNPVRGAVVPILKLPKEFEARVRAITDKRPKSVIDHILEHGSVTTEELTNLYGYSHAPRAARDVRERGRVAHPSRFLRRVGTTTACAMGCRAPALETLQPACDN